jgi:ribose transport system substrate-binding protein
MANKKRLVQVALVAASLMAVAACGSSKSGSTATPTTAASGGSTATTTAGTTGTTTSAPATGGNAAYLAAVAATAKSEKGTNFNVDPSPRPAAKNKFIVVISSGQASISSQIPSDAAVAAAKALGWKVDLYDAKLNPSNYSPLIRQAIAAGAQGIISDAIDCQAAKSAWEQAVAKKIVIIPMYAFDCTDAHAGAAKTGVFNAITNYGPAGANIDAFTESYGADQANYIIAASHNTAKIIVLQDPEFVVLYYTYQGFAKQIAASGGSKIVDTLNFTVADLGDGQLAPKVQAALLRYPDATWIKSPYTAATTAGIVPGLGANPHHVDVMGGEGFPPELDLIRAGKITAVNIISSQWTGWAAIDTMNSIFDGLKPAVAGIGWTIADATHNLPKSGPFNPPINFIAEYEKAWGVSG